MKLSEQEYKALLEGNPALREKDAENRFKTQRKASQSDLIPLIDVTNEGNKRKKYEYLEFKLQIQVVKYLQFKYPDVLFESSPINLNLTKAQRKMMSAIQKKGFHPPDIKIFEARRGHHGFALELKKETPYLKDGITLKKSEHLANQQKSIEAMGAKGWLAGFFWEFDSIKTVIDWYLE